MFFVAGVSAWFVGLVAMLIISQRLLAPLEEAAKHKRLGMQFTLADWMCLVAMVQIWAALAHTFTSVTRAELSFVLIIDGLGWGLITIMWFGAVRRLSAAGVHYAWHRAGMLLIVYPLNVVGAIATPTLLWAGILILFADAAHRPSLIWAGLCWLAVIAILVAMLAAARFVRRIVPRPDPVFPVVEDALWELDQESLTYRKLADSPDSGKCGQRDERGEPQGGDNDCRD